MSNITKADVHKLQENWGNAILAITKAFQEKKDYLKVASDAAAELYAYEKTPNVLFKPTKAAENPFRPKGVGALSYFVGGIVVGKGGYGEDTGFAINGGKGWSHVKFDNHIIDLNGTRAVCMGHYSFTCATTGDVAKVEYTLGYKRNSDGKARIYLHHSSMPYQKPMALPITESEVNDLQLNWGNAILAITKAYQNKEDFVKVASDAAAELYAYGHSEVLFKPTKAADNPFRPTAIGALSYFVGAAALDGKGFSEDKGFAHNVGKGWSKVGFENHKIDLDGEIAFAMGHYSFTCATTGHVSKIEYTFGYKRSNDGKARIFVHHSSMPYDGRPHKPKK